MYQRQVQFNWAFTNGIYHLFLELSVSFLSILHFPKSSRTSLIMHDFNIETEITPEDLISRPLFFKNNYSAEKMLANGI